MPKFPKNTSAFRMSGMTFKEDQSPMYKISLKEIGERITNIPKNTVENLKGKDTGVVDSVKDFISGDSDVDVTSGVESSETVPPTTVAMNTPELPTTPIVKKSPAKIYDKPKGKRTEYIK